MNASDEATKDSERVAHLMRIAAVDVAVGARRKMTGPGHRSAGAEGWPLSKSASPHIATVEVHQSVKKSPMQTK